MLSELYCPEILDISFQFSNGRSHANISCEKQHSLVNNQQLNKIVQDFVEHQVDFKVFQAHND